MSGNKESQKKEVILVTAHVPDESRQSILRELVCSIDKDLFDIVISANTPVPRDILQNARYVIYDNSNELIYDFEKKIGFWYSYEDFYVQSTELKDFNHIVAAQRLVTNGLSWCKAAGYEKLHFLEYDSKIENYDIFNENSKILDTVSLVYYLHHQLGLYSSYSVNLKTLPDYWFDVDQKKMYEFLESKEEKIIEVYGYFVFLETSSKYQRDLEKDYRRSVKSNLFNSDGLGSWSTVLVKEEEMFWWAYNIQTQGHLNTKIVVNESVTLEKSLAPDCWYLHMIGKIQDVKNIKVFVEEKMKKEYDFTKIDVLKFGKFNNIYFREN